MHRQETILHMAKLCLQQVNKVSWTINADCQQYTCKYRYHSDKFTILITLIENM